MNWKEFANNNSDWLKAKKNNNKEISFIDLRDTFEDIWIFSVSKNKFCIGNLSQVCIKKQYEIIKFINQDPKKWFEEHKYYIIVGKDVDDDCDMRFYKKDYGNGYFIAEGGIGELHKKECEFTQEDIDDLKSHLPEEFRRIVDLAKVEVTD